MLTPWTVEEMKTANLGDKRLNKRLAQVLSDLAERPTASIPAACGGKAETDAAYDLFDNPKVTYEKVLQPHVDATRQRIAEHEAVLFVQDTTELDVTRPEQPVVGAGPTDSVSRRGAYLHLMEAFTPDGTPLGAVGAEMWTRDDAYFSKPQKEKRRRRKALPIEEKESFRWLEGLRHAREVAQERPQVQGVCVGDSEADIDHLFAEPRGEQPVHWLIRACQERCSTSLNDREVFHKAATNGSGLFSSERWLALAGGPAALCGKRRRIARGTTRLRDGQPGVVHEGDFGPRTACQDLV